MSSAQPPQTDSESDSSNQPLPVATRRDLVISQTGSATFPLWTIKDPVAEKFFQLRLHDFFVFSCLDGKTSIAEIQNKFYSAHAPQQLSREQILSFVQRLFAQGLVQLNRFGTSSAIKLRADKIRSSERKQKLTSLLAIRFRGIDPDAALTSCLAYVRWCFSPVVFAICVLLFMTALSIAIAEWGQVYRELPRFNTFLQSGHFLWFMVTIAVIKVLHELAHALTCKYFGGECHELGVMLLAFTPCLYCNVSDAWLMKNRWHRIAISGAGIYLEVVVASISTLIWYWTVPGFLHTICLYLMVVSSVSTIFLNGNPLLRYDGYYILSDLVQVPNLRGRSQALVRSWWMRIFFGIRSADPLRGQKFSKTLLGIYGVLSSLYIWFVVFAILWMLYQLAKPYGLQPIVVIFGVLILSHRIAGVGQTAVATLVSLNRRNQFRVWRFGIATALAASVVIFVALLEFPRQIRVPCIIEPGESTAVYVSSPGRVQFANVAAGEYVTKETRIAVMQNRELEREVLKLQGQYEKQKMRIELLIQRQSRDPDVAAEIPTARAALLDYEAQLKNKQADLSRLTLLAPQSGVILPIEYEESILNETEEFRYDGNTLEAQNEGAWLESGTKLCIVADQNSIDAVLYVDQAEAVLLKIGKDVSVATNHFPGKKMVGEIIEISAEPLSIVPPVLMRLELLPYEPGSDGRLKPAYPIHEVRVRLQVSEQTTPFGQVGQAVVQLHAETVADRLLRMLRRSVTFEL